MMSWTRKVHDATVIYGEYPTEREEEVEEETKGLLED
jgi:hypothetical protein